MSWKSQILGFCQPKERNMKNKFGNLSCPYCKMVLTKACFERGRWQCMKCEKLLDYETFKEFYNRQAHEAGVK